MRDIGALPKRSRAKPMKTDSQPKHDVNAELERDAASDSAHVGAVAGDGAVQVIKKTAPGISRVVNQRQVPP
jgi:hypothetical protein